MELEDFLDYDGQAPLKGTPVWDAYQAWIAETKVQMKALEEELEKEIDEMRDVTCKKCTTKLGYGLDSARYERALIGGYKAVICVECINAWRDYLIETGAGNNAFDRVQALDRDLKIVGACFATTGGNQVQAAKDEMRPLYAQRDAIDRELYILGKEWAADTIPTPATVTP